METWKDINGWSKYQISSLGQIRTFRKRPKILNPFIDDGYYCVSLFDGKKSFKKSVHRIYALHFLDGYFEGAHINHKDGNKKNNHLSNLEWYTPKENQIHAYSIGLKGVIKSTAKYQRPFSVELRIKEIKAGDYMPVYQKINGRISVI